MILQRAEAGDAELRLPGRAARPRRRVDLLPASAAARRPSAGSRGSGLDRRGDGDDAPSVELIHVDGSEEDLLAASPVRVGRRLGDRDPRPHRRPRPRRAGASCSATLVGERANRRHRPGRGFEALRYRFEIVSDYGAFRDLQRHRMLTCQWQRLGPDLGAGVPEEVREAGAGDEFERALEISRAEYERLARRRAAPTPRPTRSASPTGSATSLDLNAREAMHLIELRSGREGHPTYRAVAQAMHERIAAVHPGVAAAMTHVDTSTEPRLERIMSEIRTHRKRVAARAASPSPPTPRRASARWADRGNPKAPIVPQLTTSQ